MSEIETGWYEIRLKGHLGPRWGAWFDGLVSVAQVAADRSEVPTTEPR